MSKLPIINLSIERYEPFIELVTKDELESSKDKDIGRDDYNNDNDELIDRLVYSEGELIVYFANLLNDEKQYIAIQECFEIENSNISIETYYQKCLVELTSLIGNKYAKIVIIDAQNEYLRNKRKTTLGYQEEKLRSKLKELCILGERHAKIVNDITDNPEKQSTLYGMLLDLSGDMGGHIQYGVCPALKNGKLTLVDVYTATTGESAIILDFVSVLRNDIKIKLCANCGKYFVPTSRSDEIYCDNVYRNNKTCKQLGYEIKVSSDEVLKSYRTIYKTQNARKQRSRQNIHDIDIRFNRWSEYAKKQLELCRHGGIALDELINRISGKEWMTKEEV